MKLSTTLIHLNTIPNPVNASLVNEFYEYLKEIGTSDNHSEDQTNNLSNLEESVSDIF